MKDKILTTNQAASELGVSTIRIRQLIQNGLICAMKFGNTWIIDKERFDEAKRNPPRGWPSKRKKRNNHSRFDNFFNGTGDQNEED